MARIKVRFTNFWPGFDAGNNKFVEILRKAHEVEIIGSEVGENPDILIYSCFGDPREHLKQDCIKVYFTGENDVPNFNLCDYGISFYPIDFGDRHLRYPLYMAHEYDRLGLGPEPADAFEREFCSLVMSNATTCDPRRLEWIDVVQSYRPISYGGAYRNNVGGRVPDKLEFIKNYKFNLALENSLTQGYVTEKLLEPLVARTVPVYWGDDWAVKDFNPEAFIRIRDYDSPESFLQALQSIDSDRVAYMKMLTAPPLLADRAADFDARLSDFFDRIIRTRHRYVSGYGQQQKILSEEQTLAPIRKSRLLMNLLRR